MGGVYKAVNLYLKAIYSQNDFERYLEQYEVFKTEIRGDKLHELKIAAGIAHCKLKHLNQAEAILAKLNEDRHENSESYLYLNECAANLKKTLN